MSMLYLGVGRSLNLLTPTFTITTMAAPFISFSKEHVDVKYIYIYSNRYAHTPELHDEMIELVL